MYIMLNDVLRQNGKALTCLPMHRSCGLTTAEIRDFSHEVLGHPH
jgi:hypothetical protein